MKNYYIQGSSERAEEIKAEFEKLGYDTSRHLFNAKTVLYFTFDGDIRATTNGLFITFIKSRSDYKELELPVLPKFKVGDKVVFGTLHETIAVVLINEKRYLCETFREILFEEQDRWHLAPKPHYDISNFKPFDKVLCRNCEDGKWRADYFSNLNDNGRLFVGIGYTWHQCIPFEGNEHLLGTTDMPSEEFINW